MSESKPLKRRIIATVNRFFLDSPGLPNFLSGFRLVAAPFLVYLAWTGHPNLFLALLAASLFSDAIDGFVARRLNAASELGTRLDSWGDMVTYLIVPVCAWWLWPVVIMREVFFVLVAVAAYVIPLVVGFVKFKRLPSYHTWAAKGAAVLMSFSVIILFTAGIAGFFRVAALFQALVACEEVAITIRLAEWQCNVPSFWHLTGRSKETSMDRDRDHT